MYRQCLQRFLQGSALDSIASALDVYGISPRSSVHQAYIVCRSDLELYRIGMQKKKNQHAQVCSSVATEEASEGFWIMIEFTYLL